MLETYVGYFRIDALDGDHSSSRWYLFGAYSVLATVPKLNINDLLSSNKRGIFIPVLQIKMEKLSKVN